MKRLISLVLVNLFLEEYMTGYILGIVIGVALINLLYFNVVWWEKNG